MALHLLVCAAMLSLDELLSDPLLQAWDIDRVVTALTHALRQRRYPEVQRWFYFNGHV